MNTLREIVAFTGVTSDAGRHENEPRRRASIRSVGTLVTLLSSSERTSMRAMIGGLQRLPPITLDAHIEGETSAVSLSPRILVQPSSGMVVETVVKFFSGADEVQPAKQFDDLIDGHEVGPDGTLLHGALTFGIPGAYVAVVTRTGITNTGVTVLQEKLGFSSLAPPPPPPPPPPPTLNVATMVNVNTNNFNTTNITLSSARAASFPRSAAQPHAVMANVGEAIRYFESPAPARAGQLVVVGSGIRAISDMTLDAQAQIRAAEKVVYCVADPVTERQLHALNPAAESLYGLYGDEKPRVDTYREMVEAILTPVRSGFRVCAVFYGHPGAFAWSSHEAVRIARREGHFAEMHAGVSADASLFADLGIDPCMPGCHSLEATDFVLHGRTPDVRAHLLLWQVECVGDFGFRFAGYSRKNFHVLVERLREFYPSRHPVVIYEAAQLPQGRPTIIPSALDTITKDHLTGISTLYVPPATSLTVDREVARELGVLSGRDAAERS